LIGVTVRAARLLAAQSGYEIGRVSEIELAGDSDVIVGQFPAPESTSPLDERIDVLVSKAVDPAYVMPDLRDWNLNRALVFLERNSFTAEIFYRRHRGSAKGSIVRQFPEPGYPLRETDSVNLEVAR
jgi:beta-lactam-binding protein with PASTA domain